MEINKIKFQNMEVYVIFTGKNYFFHNSFYGYLAIAERTDESFERLGKDTNLQYFVVYSGNSRWADGFSRNCFEMAEKFIKKNESRYLKTICNFSECEIDLNKCHVDLSYNLGK